MYLGGAIYRFGLFELDAARRRLMRGPNRILLPGRHLDLLLLFARNPGVVLSKDALIEAAWSGVAVEDNGVEKAVSNVRKALGCQDDGSPYIETLQRQGYRLVAPVECLQARRSDVELEASLVPHRAFVDEGVALQSLTLESAIGARVAFEGVLAVAPDHAASHVGTANACAQCYESTRADAKPDTAALRQALHHAREACRLAESWGEAWATFAFVLHRDGQVREARAAARKAVTLEPDNWRHWLRLAAVSWGEERLRATRRVLALRPRLALAHWFAASVFVARQAWDFAIQELRAGCAAQDTQRKGITRFNGVGLHLLFGLVLAATGEPDAAMEEFEGELACDSDGLLYARECRANTWYTIGALRLRRSCIDDARAAFQRALDQVPGHALATIGLRTASGLSPAPPVRAGASAVDAAVGRAAVLALHGRHDDAAHVVCEVLARAEGGSAGWLVPVDPLLQTTAHGEAWAKALDVLRDRAG